MDYLKFILPTRVSSTSQIHLALSSIKYVSSKVKKVIHTNMMSSYFIRFLCEQEKEKRTLELALIRSKMDAQKIKGKSDDRGKK